MVDIHSDTWRIVRESLLAEKERAIKYLISDKDSERQRGKLNLIDVLLSLEKPVNNDPLIQDNYQ